MEISVTVNVLISDQKIVGWLRSLHASLATEERVGLRLVPVNAFHCTLKALHRGDHRPSEATYAHYAEVIDVVGSQTPPIDISLTTLDMFPGALP